MCTSRANPPSYRGDAASLVLGVLLLMSPGLDVGGSIVHSSFLGSSPEKLLKFVAVGHHPEEEAGGRQHHIGVETVLTTQHQLKDLYGAGRQGFLGCRDHFDILFYWINKVLVWGLLISARHHLSGCLGRGEDTRHNSLLEPLSGCGDVVEGWCLDHEG
jgi:hypothetical protein